MPTIPFKGFCGPSYQLTNKYATIERTVNWFLTPNEGAKEEGKGDVFHEPTPGNAAFGTLPVPAPFNQANRALVELRGNVFGVNGTVVFYLKSDGTYHKLGSVPNDGTPCCMVANGNAQIFISSVDQGFVIQVNAAAPEASTLIDVNSANFLGASYATMQDGYIIVLTPTSNQYQISGNDDTPVGDATLWDGANISIQTGQADLGVAIISSREYLRWFGARRIQVHADVGAAGGFPFAIYNDTFIETGCGAAFSVVDLGDSLIWIGQDSRGQQACWRDMGFQPQRVSTLAVERFWQGYSKVSDAVAFSFIWMGHHHYRITFPSATVSSLGVKTSATWDYDVTASQVLGVPIWTELSFQAASGFAYGRSELFHCYGYGKHLVGSTGTDGNPGAIYQYSATQYGDCRLASNGSQEIGPVIRDRICPHIWQNNNRVIYNRLKVECSKGVGLDGDPTAVGADPQLLMRYSNDAGNTWSNEVNVSVGKNGVFEPLVYFNQLGYARDRVFWVRYSDPTYFGLVAATLDLSPLGA